MAGERITWSQDGSAAYRIDERGNIADRWIKGRPDLSTFDPFAYQYGGGYSYGQNDPTPAYMYDVWQGGGAGGGTAGGGDFYYPPDRTELDLAFDALDLEYTDRQRAREENRRQFDERLQLDARRLEQEIAIARERMQHETGLERQRSESRLRELEAQYGYDRQLMQLDWSERQKLADKELAMRLREIQGQERMAAAETWARPIDYLAYSRWMAGQPAATTESGLPVGAPGWQTGEPEPATVGAGAVATGGADIYGQQLAGGGRIQEFGAWGGPTTPVGGTPWISPHKANVAQFSAMPLQAQEMAYARWRQRGIMPETAQQAMYAAAPTGTAGQRVVGYG